MRKILDVTDRRTRAKQQVLILACAVLACVGICALLLELTPTYVGAIFTAASIALLALTANIKQRWDIRYRGHSIRVENSIITAERLFLDEGLVARGGAGKKIELRAPIRVGEGAGEEVVAIVDARIRSIQLRIFVEGADSSADTISVPPSDSPARSQQREAAVEDLKPAVSSVVIGRLTLAKHILEFIAALIAVVGFLIGAAIWFFSKS